MGKPLPRVEVIHRVRTGQFLWCVTVGTAMSLTIAMASDMDPVSILEHMARAWLPTLTGSLLTEGWREGPGTVGGQGGVLLSLVWPRFLLYAIALEFVVV